MTLAELLEKHPVIEVEVRGGAGRFGDQLAFDHQRCALGPRKAARLAQSKGRLAFFEAALAVRSLRFATRGLACARCVGPGSIDGATVDCCSNKYLP
jgi:hypothetical protein